MNYNWIGDLDSNKLRIIKISENEYNLIDKDDNLICKENYKFIFDLDSDKLRRVQLSDNNYNLLSKSGNLFLKENYEYIFSLDNDELRIVKLSDNKYNLSADEAYNNEVGSHLKKLNEKLQNGNIFNLNNKRI